MGFYLSPLVKVNEIDLSTTVPAVATSIAALVIRNAYKGPELKQAFVSNEQELIDMFGYPTSDTGCIYDMFSALGYLKYGNKLYVTRALSYTGPQFAGISISSTGTTGSITVDLAALEQDDPNTFANTLPTGTPVTGVSIIADSRGEWGNNVRVAFLDRATQYNLLVSGTSSTGPQGIFKSIDNRIAGDAGTTGLNSASKNFLVLVQAQDQGKSVYTTKEIFNVSTDPNAIDDIGQPTFAEKVINEQSSFIRITASAGFEGITFPTAMSADVWYQLSGGTGTSETVTDADILNNYNLYSNPEEVNITMFIDGGKSDTTKNSLITLAESRLDCISILDCPKSLVYSQRGKETTNLLTWSNANLPSSSYAAVYGNWIEIYDKWNRKYQWVPVSGYLAGIYAKTDDVRDAWWAPAGLNRAILTGVRRLAWNPSLGNRDMLYSNRINPIVSFSGQGKVVWGQKTLLSKSSAFDRINVRRLFIVLEKAISTACKYFLFEPNNPATRALIVNMITPFLRDVKARGGVYDFKVVSDDTVNTSERIDRNELWVNIFIKPTKTAEFIVLNFIATKTGASFTELAAAGI